MKIPTKTLNPVIKWSGSKRKVAVELSKKILSKDRYFEPFVGGGSMLPFRGVDKGIASDIIPELIVLWNEIKNNPEITASEYKVRWDKLQNDGHGAYYEIRHNFNKTKDPFDFLFLTRTCVNGLIRYNSNGDLDNISPEDYNVLEKLIIQPETLRSDDEDSRTSQDLESTDEDYIPEEEDEDMENDEENDEEYEIEELDLE